MQNIKTLSIGENKGAPRVWLEGRFPEQAGFEPGASFRVEVIRDRDCVALRLDNAGTRRVSSKARGERTIPVIDLNSKEALGIFDGLTRIRAIADGGVIYLLPVASDARVAERLARLRSKLEKNEPLSVGSLSHGGGVLSLALHEGIAAEGIKTQLTFANEIRDELLEHASEVNPAWNPKTIAVAMPIQELAYDQWAMGKLKNAEIIEAGLPCSGASKAGRAKNGNVCVEAHEHVGHLVAAFMAIVARLNPAIVIFENVVPYQSSASAWIIRHQLRDLGYEVQEAVFSGEEWGVLEHRERMCLVAVTRGMSFDLSSVRPDLRPVQRLGDLLETVPEDAPVWRDVGYLKDKEERDKAAGKGFSVPYLTPDSTHVPTLRKGYQKGGSCDARVIHPTNPSLSRLLTATEHARIKGIDERLIKGMSQTVAHELLGQSILFAPFKALGRALGAMLRGMTLPMLAAA